jgi:hypothetical protein
MITLGSFLHRDEFRGLLSRWILGNFEPEDALRIKELVNFNSMMVRLARDYLAAELLPVTYGKELSPFPVRVKGVLKDLIADLPADCYGKDAARANECIARYRRSPELFYRETPVEAITYLESKGQYVRASSRIKRIRRISDKCSRRMITWLTRDTEEPLGDCRATRRDSEMDRTFAQQVREIDALGAKTPLVIHDILGFKLLGGEPIAHRLLDWLDAKPSVTLLRRKELRGEFKATKLVVNWQVPREELASIRPGADAMAVLRARGMDADLEARLRQFILDGEDTVSFEVMVQSYGEALESEIGRCLHEERVFRQRRVEGSHENLANNIAVLTQYLFYFALSRRTSLDGIPLDLRVRYMPDRLEQVLLSLTDFPAGELGLVP